MNTVFQSRHFESKCTHPNDGTTTDLGIYSVFLSIASLGLNQKSSLKHLQLFWFLIQTDIIQLDHLAGLSDLTFPNFDCFSKVFLL